MLDRTCTHQSALVDAALSGGEPDAALAAHLAACPSCREACDAVRWMRQLADAPAEAHALPNPDVIWWKAQLLRRWDVERRAAAPIERMHKAELVGGLASLVAFVVWQWSGVSRMFSNLVPSLLSTMSAQAAGGHAASGPSGLALTLGSLLLGALILAGFHRMLSDN